MSMDMHLKSYLQLAIGVYHDLHIIKLNIS